MSVDPEAAARFEAAIEAQEALYREVTGRFQQIFSEPLDDLSAIALMHIVTLGRIDFRDRFVLNGDRLEENIMGISDAAEVMSRLRPDQRWEYWKGAYSARRGRIDDFQQARQRLVERIQAHPSVRRVSLD